MTSNLNIIFNKYFYIWGTTEIKRQNGEQIIKNAKKITSYSTKDKEIVVEDCFQISSSYESFI